MNFSKVIPPVLGVAFIAGAYYYYGWRGVALAATALVMWGLMHFTRMMKVLQRASQSPAGYCPSAVMLNAKLRPGVNLMHVMARTRSIGELLSPEGTQPEIFRWTDGTASSVTCEFRNGKLVKWTLDRPATDATAGASTNS